LALPHFLLEISQPLLLTLLLLAFLGEGLVASQIAALSVAVADAMVATAHRVQIVWHANQKNL